MYDTFQTCWRQLPWKFLNLIYRKFYYYYVINKFNHKNENNYIYIGLVQNFSEKWQSLIRGSFCVFRKS